MNLKRVFFVFFTAVLLGGGLFLSCSNIFEDGDEGGTSISLSFSMKPGIRAAETGGETYKLVAELQGDAKSQSKEYQVAENETVNISFDDVSVGTTVRVLLHVYSGETLIYRGKSEEIKVRGGRNEATVTLKHTVLYVSGSGSNSDDNTGTSREKAFKTLNRAFTEIGKTPSDDISWTIVVLGKVYSTSTMKNLEAKSITVVGEGSDAILDGRRENPEEGGTGAVFVVDESIAFDVTLSDLTIQNGQARMGAGVRARGKGTLTIENCLVQNNKAITTEEGSANGGGIVVQKNAHLLLVNTTVKRNSSESNGGGIFVGDTATLEIGDSTKITGNTATNNGAAISMGGGTFNMTGGEITENTATNNGGAFNINRGYLTISGGTISGNASGNKAGAIYVNCKTPEEYGILIEGGKITKNGAGGNGGAIFIENGSVTMTGGEISENETLKNGGGVFVGTQVVTNDEKTAVTTVYPQSEFILQGGKIVKNKATGNYQSGGGIYLNSARLLMTGGEISGNSATGKGGGVCAVQNFARDSSGNIYYTYDPSEFTMSGGAITKNTGDNGGGVYSEGNLYLSGNITVADNEARQASQIRVTKNSNQTETPTATFEYGSLGTLRFSIGATLTVNLINGTFEDEDSDELEYVFEGEGKSSTGQDSSDGTGGGTDSSYTREMTEWSESDFRNALNSANPYTDSATTTTVTLQGNVTITSDLTVENYITIDGQGKFGITIRAGNATFKNVTFTNGAGTHMNGSEKQAHGMVYWSGSGTLTFDSCTFDGNVTEGDTGGGAASLFGGGKVEFSGCTFNGNSANHGAAIDIGGSDEVKIDTCVFNANTSKDNHDIYCGGSAAKVSGSGNKSDKQNPYACTDQNADSATKSWSGFTTNP